jgi:ribosomal protein S21
MAIKVRKKEGETNQSLLFRFSRKIKQSGVLTEARKRQFKDREPNKRKKRLSAIYKSQKTKEYERMKKLGILK